MRFFLRLATICLAVKNRLLQSPKSTKKILVVHNLLLGDTLCLAPLLKKLSEQFPDHQRYMLCKRGFLELFKAKPYGSMPVPFDPRSWQDFLHLYHLGPFDLAIVIGDNRYSWLAQAVRSDQVVGHESDRVSWKNWMLPQKRAFMSRRAAWSDTLPDLVPGKDPEPFRKRDWPVQSDTLESNSALKIELPYVVCHLGASTVLKLWPTEKWQKLIDWLSERGLQVVVTCGPGEEHLLNGLGAHHSFAGSLSLSGLWFLINRADLFVSVDTGVAHIGKFTGTPSVVLFGPGQDSLHDAGCFWKHHPYASVTAHNFPCRDQHVFFGRYVPWIQRCGRSLSNCSTPGACMDAISLHDVQSAILATPFFNREF
jgi:ADP-heptose:LPS heptosyltransferase